MMDQQEYKRICEQPFVLSRHEINSAVKLLRLKKPTLAIQLSALLSTDPVPKPSQHTGGPETDCFYLSVPQQQIDEVVDFFLDLEAEYAMSNLPASWAADLGDRWYAAESYLN